MLAILLLLALGFAMLSLFPSDKPIPWLSLAVIVVILVLLMMAHPPVLAPGLFPVPRWL